METAGTANAFLSHVLGTLVTPSISAVGPERKRVAV